MSTADKLNKLITTKSAIKEAIQNKGVTVTDTDTFASYADKINSITSGGGGGYEFDFTVLGYNQEECKDANDIANVAITLGDFTQSQITEAIAYGKQLYDSNHSITNDNVDKNKLLFYPKLELPHIYKDSKVLYIPNVEYSSTGSYTTGSAYTNHLLYKVGSINAVFTNSHYSQQFFNSCNSLREVGDINITGKAIDYNNFFQNCYVLSKIGNLNTTGSTSFENMFNNCISLTSIPQLDTSSGTTFTSMFSGCTSLTEISQLDTSKGTNFSSIFNNCTADVDGLDFSNAAGQQTYQKPFYSYKGKRVSNIKTTQYTEKFFSGCSNLESATNIDASASTDHSLNNMFQNCFKLKEASFTSTSNITNFGNMFNNCNLLTSLSQLDTSSGTNFMTMFNGCRALTTIPQLNTSNGTNFNSMFSDCISLISIPQIDTSSGDRFANMFNNCTSLITIPQIDVSKSDNFNGMFYNCTSLTSLPQLDTSNGTSLENMLSQCTDLKRIEGISLKSLNKTVSYSYLTGTLSMPKLRYALIKDIGTCTDMTSASFTYWTLWGVDDETSPDARQSLIDSLLTYSFDRATAGYSTCTISLDNDTKAVLTADEIAQITAKGYTIA